MKRFLISLAVLAFAVVASALPRPIAASNHWPALLNCPDVTGQGSVAAGDIAQVVAHFGTSYELDPEAYVLLYDVDGGSQVGATDIATVVANFGDQCPLVETQVAQATLAMMGDWPTAGSGPDLRNWSAAQAAGFTTNTQYVPQMGIHVSTSNYQAEFDHTSPIGLVYKETSPGSDVPGELIGAWYIAPVQDVCDFFLAGQTCSDEEPEGFDGSEDNDDVSNVQRGWHTHTNLCFGVDENGPWVIEQGPTGSDEICTQTLGGALNFGTYGWMVHLYNFIPNPDGRFMMWNCNLDQLGLTNCD